MTFDLSKLVREVHDSTDLTDHRQVAKEVRSRIPKAEVEGALLEALTVYVANRFTTYRTPVKYAKPSSKSAKRDGIKEFWRKHLNQRYATESGQKLLREFTADDCLFQAAQDRRKAGELVAKAEQWEQLAAQVPAGKTVGDLA